MRPKTLKVFLLLYFQPVMKSVESSNLSPSLTPPTINVLVQSIIVSHLNYCNSLPIYDFSLCSDCLTFTMRAARVFLSKCKSTYVTLPLKTLQWLLISSRIESMCWRSTARSDKIWPSILKLFSYYSSSLSLCSSRTSFLAFPQTR